ncbi:hypothetical protein Y032_0003g1170 [Ancylostoma ceylanicum]|uniref:Uncharacterized protein n=1 Tax=Ancylostoma ceylanicum TaxID=53326 RepID=A0A016VWG2_9BILA|nr:hypothetical protein Y032_0003g1170 [Ancylostoma ceylanicum]
MRKWGADSRLRSAACECATVAPKNASGIHRPSAESRRAPMHYHTCRAVAQSTRSVAGGKYFSERLYIGMIASIWLLLSLKEH